MSAVATLRFGVPQSSVLGPNLFVLYAAEVIAIAEQHGFIVHAYADDLQLYYYDDPSSCTSLVSRLSACVNEIQEWMASSRQRLNTNKTELIWLGAARYVRVWEYAIRASTSGESSAVIANRQCNCLSVFRETTADEITKIVGRAPAKH